jgi:hypothetical protein
MADTNLAARYLELVEKLERLGVEMNLVQKEVDTVMEAMTEEEVQELAKGLRPGQHAVIRALELHLQQRHSPPVE